MRVIRMLGVSVSTALVVGSAAIVTVVALHVADLWPFGYLGTRLWDSPLEALIGALGAILAVAGGVLVATRNIRGQISTSVGVALSTVLAVVAVGASLVFLGASSVAYLPQVEVVPEVNGR